MYELLISKKAEREIEKLPFEIQDKIFEALLDIRQDPYFGKPLTEEYEGYFSYKIGVYRIIYKINEKDKKVFISTAGHRSIVYQY